MCGYLPIANSEPPSRYTKGFHPQKYTSKKSNPNITTALTNYKTKKRYKKTWSGESLPTKKGIPQTSLTNESPDTLRKANWHRLPWTEQMVCLKSKSFQFFCPFCKFIIVESQSFLCLTCTLCSVRGYTKFCAIQKHHGLWIIFHRPKATAMSHLLS